MTLTRSFLWGFAASIAVLGVDAQTTQRPNILFMVADDMRWDALGHVQGGPDDGSVVRRFPWFAGATPNLDRLASEGVRFTHAFATMSLCSPSRAAMLTGRYNHLNGVANNKVVFPANSTTWATTLQAAGYMMGYVGKWDMVHQTVRPGFTHAASYNNQGYTIMTFYGDLVTRFGKHQGWVDDVAAQYALDFLQVWSEEAGSDTPFALQVSFKSPHDPYKAPNRTATLFANETYLDAPDSDLLPSFSNTTISPKRDADTLASVRLNYIRCVAAMDDNVGQLLSALETLGVLDNTVVVFTSDNGYHWGEHGLSEMKSTAYEESFRIPLLARYPGKFPANRSVKKLVANIDIAPTFVELAGLTGWPEIQGSSWVPLASETSATLGKTPWRNHLMYEYFATSEVRGIPTMVGLRTKKQMLIEYPGEAPWSELYHVSSDDYETKNTVDAPGRNATLAKMAAAMAEAKAATGYVVPSYAG